MDDVSDRGCEDTQTLTVSENGIIATFLAHVDEAASRSFVYLDKESQTYVM